MNEIFTHPAEAEIDLLIFEYLVDHEPAVEEADFRHAPPRQRAASLASVAQRARVKLPARRHGAGLSAESRTPAR